MAQVLAAQGVRHAVVAHSPRAERHHRRPLRRPRLPHRHRHAGRGVRRQAVGARDRPRRLHRDLPRSSRGAVERRTRDRDRDRAGRVAQAGAAAAPPDGHETKPADELRMDRTGRPAAAVPWTRRARGFPAHRRGGRVRADRRRGPTTRSRSCSSATASRRTRSSAPSRSSSATSRGRAASSTATSATATRSSAPPTSWRGELGIERVPPAVPRWLAGQGGVAAGLGRERDHRIQAAGAGQGPARRAYAGPGSRPRSWCSTPSSTTRTATPATS